jgi:hypothetical protein
MNEIIAFLTSFVGAFIGAEDYEKNRDTREIQKSDI